MNAIHDCPACGTPTRRKTCCLMCLLHWSQEPNCECRKCVIVEKVTERPVAFSAVKAVLTNG